MIILKASLMVPPERQKELAQAVHALLGKVRCMWGCSGAQLMMDTEHDCHFAIYEEWLIEEELNKYLASEHCRVLFGAISVLSESYKLTLTVSNAGRPSG